MKKNALSLSLAVLMLHNAPLLAHQHFAAEVVDTNNNGKSDAGEPLRLAAPNGTAYLFKMRARPYTTAQQYGGYYSISEDPRVLDPNDSFTFIAYSDGQTQTDPVTHPKTGADIWMEITSVTGPAGAKFGFWEGQNFNVPAASRNRSLSFQTPSYSFLTNTPITGFSTPTGRFMFEISEPIAGDPLATQDPFGHIHSRGWTVDKPGDYYVGFTLYDRSTVNAGGPIHTPSPTYVYHFQAGPEFVITPNKTSATTCVLTWPSLMGTKSGATGIAFTVQRSTTLAAGSWTTLGTVTGTTAATATFTDNTLSGFTKAFYRLQYSWAP
jgi:hypothetical protein